MYISSNYKQAIVILGVLCPLSTNKKGLAYKRHINAICTRHSSTIFLYTHVQDIQALSFSIRMYKTFKHYLSLYACTRQLSTIFLYTHVISVGHYKQTLFDSIC